MMIAAPLRHAPALALALAACTDSRPPDDVEPLAAAYLVGTRVWDDSSTTSYFHVVDSLEAGTEIDLREAIESPGPAKLFAIGELGWFAIGGGEAPTITRYELGADNRLTEGLSISLQGHGVDSLWDTMYVVSPTKAYYPDRDGQQLIVWNPTEMVITGTIDLRQTDRPGFLSLYSYTPIVRGDQLLFTVGWFDWSANDMVLGETGLVVIDTAADLVARFDVDPRCGGITQAIATASGDAYLVSSALAGAAHRLDRLPTAPCALRIRGGETTFDAGYHMALGELTGGAIAGEPVPGGADRIFLRVFDEGAATIAPGSATWELTGQLAWQWWAWDVAANTASKLDALPASTADVLWFQLDGRVFGTATTADYATTTLIDLTAAGGPTPALTAPGFLHGATRIR
jgi:hypothetical protein